MNEDQNASDSALRAIFEKDIRYERDASPAGKAQSRTPPLAGRPEVASKRKGVKPNGPHEKQIG